MKTLLLTLTGVLILAAVLLFFVAPPVADRLFNPVEAAPPYEARAEARQLHETLFVADLHADALLWKRDPLARHGYGHVDVPRLREGNVGLQVFSVVTKSPWGQNYQRTEGDSDRITLLAVAQGWPVETWSSLRERALYQARRLRLAAGSDDRLVLIGSRADLDAFVARRASEPGLVAGLLALEGLHPMEGRMAHLPLFFDAGYRMMAPTHMFDNALAGSGQGAEQYGLTELGREAVRWMEANGVVVDLAHASPAAIDDVLAMATRPVVVSHTGVQATCPSPRNLSDAHLRGIAATGGVVGVGYWEGAVCEGGVDAIVRAMRHVADLVGVEHVALGSDFDGTVRTPFDTSGLAQLTDALLAAGFTPDEVRLVMGENVLRVLRATLPAG